MQQPNDLSDYEVDNEDSNESFEESLSASLDPSEEQHPMLEHSGEYSPASLHRDSVAMARIYRPNFLLNGCQIVDFVLEF